MMPYEMENCGIHEEPAQSDAIFSTGMQRVCCTVVSPTRQTIQLGGHVSPNNKNKKGLNASMRTLANKTLDGPL